jgi:hypothetical protein
MPYSILVFLSDYRVCRGCWGCGCGVGVDVCESGQVSKHYTHTNIYILTHTNIYILTHTNIYILTHTLGRWADTLANINENFGSKLL